MNEEKPSTAEKIGTWLGLFLLSWIVFLAAVAGTVATVRWIF